MAQTADQKRGEKDALDRLTDARAQKAIADLDLRECYFFAAPWRMRSVSSLTRGAATRPDDAGDLRTSFAMEMADDFPTVILDTFMPQSVPWVRREAGIYVPASVRDQISDKVLIGDGTIFKAISASNFYGACGVTFTPDLAIGTVGMWIQKGRPGEPVSCKGIPVRELEINLGPDGQIDDRFHVRWVRNRNVKTIIPGIELPRDIQTKLEKKGDDWSSVTFGFWRDWTADHDVVWKHVVLVEDRLVHEATLTGNGSCPLLVGRFGASDEFAWATGPMIKSLPDLRNLDALNEGKIKAIDVGLQPPVSWPDDSFANIEQGLETGMAYPVRTGTAGDIKAIYEPHPPQAAIFERQDLEHRIKRLHFLDWPEQTGDTPPTATQWLDEMTMAQRRIGLPGMSFWREFCASVFTRFAFILQKDGLIEEVVHDGKQVSLQPYNPAQRAAEKQEVAQFARLAEIGGMAFPEEWKAMVNGGETLKNLSRKISADSVVVFRKPEELQGALEMIKPLLGGATPGAPDAATASPTGPALNLEGQGAPDPTFQFRQFSK
jgi:hypothetical protein